MSDVLGIEIRAALDDKATAGIAGVRKAIDQLGAAARETGKTTRASGEEIATGMRTALPTVRSVTDAMGQQTAALRAQAAAMKTDEGRTYIAQQKALREEIEALQRPAKSSADKLLSIGTALKGLLALQVVGWAKDAGMAIYEATAEMDSMSRGLTAVMGSSRLAAAEMERLKEVAKLPGLGYAEAIRMSTSLQAAGMSADMARKAMGSFGNALATVGKGKADLDGVGLALSQIMSKGKISAEEINQIAERVPQIRKAMLDAFGTADTELLGKAGMSSANFIASISDELGKLEKATGGVANSTENLSDAWFRLKASIGGSGTVFASAMTALANTVEWANQKTETYNRRVLESQRKTAEQLIREWNNGGKERNEAMMRDGDIASRYFARDQAKRVAEARKLLAGIAAEQAKADAAEKARAEKMRVDFEAGLDKQIGGKKAALQTLLAVERKNYEQNLATAKANGTSLEKVEAAHQAEMKRIREEAAPKKKGGEEDLGWNDPKRIKAARDYAERINREADQKRAANAKAFRDNERRANDDYYREGIERARAALDEEMRMQRYWDEFRLEQEERRDQEIKKFEEAEEAKRQALAQTLGMHNSTITAMLKGEQGMHAGIRQMWDDTGTAIINKGLEVFEDWVATELMKQTFSDTARAAELAKDTAQAGATAAAWTPAAVMANAASWGGAAIAGGVALAALVATYAARETGGSAMGGTLLVGERGPEMFRPTVPGQIINHHQTSNSYGGDTFIIQGGGDAKSIIRQIERAQSRRKRGSRM